MISIILVLALLLRIWNLNQSFWLDEAAQVIESARPLYQQLDIPADFHPPLYHLLLHFWLILGKSEIWARLPSVFLGVGSVYLIYRLGKILFTSNVGLLSALFVATSAYHIWYSQEARPYMLFVFLVLLSTLLLLKKKWTWYTLSAVLLLYSLYFAPFVIFGHLIYVYFHDKKEIGMYLKCVLIASLFFLPWLPFLVNQIEVGTNGFFTGWKDIVSVPVVKIIPLTFAKFILGRGSIKNIYFDMVLLLPELVIFLTALKKIYSKKKDHGILFFFFIPLISAALFSLIIPISAPQRLIFLMPFYFLLIAYGIIMTKGYLKYIGIAVVLMINLVTTLDYYTNPYIQREQWREATSFIESGYKDALAVFVFPEPFAPFQWYQRGIIEVAAIALHFNVNDDDLIRLEKRIINKKKVYLFQYLSGLTDPEDKTKRFLLTKGYSESEIKDFPGVGFVYIFEKS